MNNWLTRLSMPRRLVSSSDDLCEPMKWIQLNETFNQRNSVHKPIIGSTNTKTSHQALGGLLKNFARLWHIGAADIFAFLCEQTQIQANCIHDWQTPIFLFQRLQHFDDTLRACRLIFVRFHIVFGCEWEKSNWKLRNASARHIFTYTEMSNSIPLLCAPSVFHQLADPQFFQPNSLDIQLEVSDLWYGGLWVTGMLQRNGHPVLPTNAARHSNMS